MMLKRMRKQSIRQKLFTGMLLTTLSALLIFGTALILYDLRDYHDRRIEDLATQSRLMGLTVVPALQFNDPSVAAVSLRVLAVRPTILAAAIYDAEGKLFASYRSPEVVASDETTGIRASVPEALSESATPIDSPGGEGADAGAVTTPGTAPLTTTVTPPLATTGAERAPETGSSADSDTEIFPGAPQTDSQQVEGDRLMLFRRISYNGELLGTVYMEGRYQLYQRLIQYAGIVIGVALLALALSMLLSLRMQKHVSRPILGITTLARQVTEQRNYSLRAERLTDDEIGYLVDAFNDLLAQVQFGSAALEASNSQLQQEIADRRRANDEIRDLNAQLEQRVLARTAELQRANRELEAFSYSVSHDLRTPLRAIDGFSQALLEDYAEQLDQTGSDYLQRVRAGAQRMGRLIDDLLNLARVSRAALNREPVNLSAIANSVVEELRGNDPARDVEVVIAPGLTARGDPQLLRIALENLLNNAWKYSGKRSKGRIEFGLGVHEGRSCYFIRDNGAGFDMTYAGKLFGAFQRLHEARDYPGTGVGLATVQRIIHRHGGQIWANAVIDEGAAFFFTLPNTRENQDE